ncbi:MAG: tRNA (cytidine(56)-2'-O)-methyltransferase [Theionarchaea archaeon]|nr:tRNA (cytidine(56)-2'-O)-methyltransferase [Theionarchaea archaeon]MBU7034816.1 tRNA (cytidine(56)-2'-O)-methyltransferase [Theionarchaea archaeon]MBU7040271.1 tRNA (cytidine(56)-2'-O)-methyltransferase [Theionarchaea archaeon]
MITVLRIGHRPQRDKRITTHVCLVARAFGADTVIVDRKDLTLQETIARVSDRWGGTFSVSFQPWRKVLSTWEGLIVHLTMYGLPLEEKISAIRTHRDILVVVGAEKVPREVYDMADSNISVTNQPHSEVAALALFLDRYFQGTQLNREFCGNLRITPSKKEKLINDVVNQQRKAKII